MLYRTVELRSAKSFELFFEPRELPLFQRFPLSFQFPWELVELVMSFSTPSVLAAFCGTSFKALQDAGKHLDGRVEIKTVPAFRAFFHHVSALSPHSRIFPFLPTSQIHTLHLNITSSRTLSDQGFPLSFSPIQTPSRLASLPSTLPLRHLRISFRETDYADALKTYFSLLLRHLNPVNFTLELTPNHARYIVHTDIGNPAAFSCLSSWTSLESIQLVGIFPHSSRISPFHLRSRTMDSRARMKEIPKLKITLDTRTNEKVWESGATISVGGAWCRSMKELLTKLVASGLMEVKELEREERLRVLLGDEEEKRLFEEGMQEVGLSGTERGERIRAKVVELG